MESTRRDFLSSAASAGALPFLPSLAADALAREGRPSRVLVVVELAGGNDALNTLVPFEDDAYYRARPRLGIKKAQCLRVADGAGLHPALKPLLPLWDRGELALVEGIGYPKPNRSHFHSMDIWHAADPEVSVLRSGWLGRAVEGAAEPGRAAPALAIAGRMPAALFSQKLRLPSIGSLRGFRVLIDGRSQEDGRLERRILRRNLSDRRSGATERVRASFEAAVAESDRVQKLAAANRTSVAYPRGLGDRLRLVAALLGAGHASRVYWTSTGGYDTHAGQAGTQQGLHAAFAGAVAAFYEDLRARGLDESVVLFAFSEFGRRVRENASRGTDHGAAGLAFLAGPSVRGGLHGARPSLTELDRGDLAFTTDFRRVYAELCEAWLRVPAEGVLGGRFEPLGLLRGRRV